MTEHKSLSREQLNTMTGYEIRRFLAVPEMGDVSVARTHAERSAFEEALDLAVEAHGTRGLEQRSLKAA